MIDALLLFIPFAIGYLVRSSMSISYDMAIRKLQMIERGMDSYNRRNRQWVGEVILWRDAVLECTRKIKSSDQSKAIEYMSDMAELMKKGAQLLVERPNIDNEVQKELS